MDDINRDVIVGSHCQSQERRGFDVAILNTVFISVVLYLHHSSYTVGILPVLVRYKVVILLQRFAVCGFLFLSGYKLMCSKSTEPAWEFARGRLIRVYGLYLIATLLFSFTVYPDMNYGVMPSVANFVVHAFCLQAIIPNAFGPDYHTIWFVSVLFVCYGFLLLTRGLVQRGRLFLGVTIGIVVLVDVIRLVAGMLGVELLSGYLVPAMCFFAVGMAVSQHKDWFMSVPAWLLCVISIGGIAGFLGLHNAIWVNEWHEQSATLLAAMAAALPLYILAFKYWCDVSLPRFVEGLVVKASYASFCVFLLHRPIWTVMTYVWKKGSGGQAVFILGGGMIVIWVIAYYVQKLYNVGVRRLG